MRDSGLAAVYERYADYLYIYCRFLLREPADAVDAIEDTFLVAVERLPGPPDDDWLRPWLFAVARNACLSRLKSGQAAAAAERVAEDDDDRALLFAALRGVSPAARDVIGLLWHGLEIAEISSVLAISRDDALSLFSRARDQLELCAVTLSVVRAGQRACPGLRAETGDWDGHLTVPLVRKLSRHIDRCAACGAQRQEELRPALLLSLTPAALLGAAVTDEALRRASVSTWALRRGVLGTAADPSSGAAAVRATACGRQGSFREDGFPKPLETVAGGGLRNPRVRIGVAAAGVAAVAVAGIAIASAGGPPARPASASGGFAGLTQGGGGTVSALGGTRPSGGASPSVPPSASPSASPSSSASASPSATPSRPASPTVSASRHASPSPSASASSPSPSPSASPAISVPSDVTLQPDQGQWPPEWQGTLTVTVSGGSLSWSIEPDRGLSFSQASGSSSATIEISAQGRGNFQPITVAAGGTTYIVDVSTRGGGGW
ncbi:MAG TPA: sigma-70 family RNA polymerase sigma factor [Trebonia sp.]|nr:sigma-70 family RNA polymerase sigma factor [Trebonia sp.]